MVDRTASSLPGAIQKSQSTFLPPCCANSSSRGVQDRLVAEVVDRDLGIRHVVHLGIPVVRIVVPSLDNNHARYSEGLLLGLSLLAVFVEPRIAERNPEGSANRANRTYGTDPPADR